MSLINKVRRPATGVVPGGKYAGGLVPNQQGNGMGIGRDGYLQMLDNIKSGRMPTADQTARIGIQQQATPAPAANPLVAGVAALQTAVAPVQTQAPAGGPPAAEATAAPAAQPSAPTAPTAPAQPRGLSISNGVDSGGGLRITNGFDDPDPTPPAQPQATQTQQPQKFARGRVPNALIDGIVRGKGGPTEDKVPAKVSPREAILPAKTVQALGGPAAIKALIERTNDGQPPESEVKGGGKYAVGYNGMYDTPNIYKQDNDKIREAVDQNFFPATRASYENASRETASAANGGNTAYAVGRALRGGMETAGSVPADLYAAGKSVAGGVKDLAGSAVSAVTPSLSSFWSGLSGRQAAVPTPAQPGAPSQSPAQATAPEPASSPNPLAQTPAEPTSAPAPVKAAQSAPDAPPPVPLIAAAQYRNTPDAPPEMRGAEYANKQLEALRQQNEGGPKVGVIEDPSKQERRAFDNFVTRSNAESAYRDAVRSGRPQNIQAAGNSLASLTQVGDNQEMKAGEFQRGMEALRVKGAQDQEAENNRAKNALAQYALQGRNALMGEAMRGSNALDLENLRGANQRYINPLAAEAMRTRNLLDATKLADATTLQTMQARMLAETDPAKRQEMLDQILALQGREPRSRYDVAMGRGTKTKNMDGSESFIEDVPYLVNKQTGEVVRQTKGQADQQPKTVTSGQIINGYRFKGGDPNKQSSWEKA